MNRNEDNNLDWGSEERFPGKQWLGSCRTVHPLPSVHTLPPGTVNVIGYVAKGKYNWSPAALKTGRLSWINQVGPASSEGSLKVEERIERESGRWHPMKNLG